MQKYVRPKSSPGSGTAGKNQPGQTPETTIRESASITKTGRKVAVEVSSEEYARLQALDDASWIREAEKAEAKGYLGSKASMEFVRSRLPRWK
ncbi:MAG: hypothetical protein ABI165_01135 [Bryobacteraceae bacterium]